MPIDKRVANISEALAGISDGSTIMMSGFGGAGFANILIKALKELNLKGLTLVVNSATHPLSFTHELIDAGQVIKVICSAARGRTKDPSPFERLWMDGKIELECLPQGTFSERIRAGGAGIPAFFTPVGFGTELTKGKEVRRFGDRDCVMETAITGDVALIRADVADKFGNCQFRFTQANFGTAMATASKMTIAEVREVVEEPLDYDRIHLPSVYVNRLLAVGK